MNCPRDKVIDHINHDTLDNRKSNLRICTHFENQQNLRSNKSGIVGVHKRARGSWVGKISKNNKIYLNSSGTFAVATAGADAFSGATGTVEETDGETVDVDALTGATVTSKAVVRCVNSAVAYVTGADAVSAATTWGG